jgi:hypothetical protein
VKLERVSDNADVVCLRAVDSVIRGDPSPDLNGVGDLLGEQGYSGLTLLSLADTEFIDSSGLSWLLECHQKFSDAGGRLVIHSVPPSVMDTLMMMRLELVLNVAEDEAAASIWTVSTWRRPCSG